MSDEEARAAAALRYLADTACARDDNEFAFLAGWDDAARAWTPVEEQADRG